ncbi:MAG: hypothetical protein ACLP1X_13090 [Polyangiaceae bacterium]
MTRSTIGAVLLFLGCASGVAVTQPRLAATAHDVRDREDVYPLPPPPQLHLATLGWDSAVVDMLWAGLLVAYGTHWSEHRDFKGIPRYVDAILELEPTYAPVYRFVDTLLAYRPLQGTDEDVRLARRYLEQGTRERPEDQRLWMRYGQFLAFIAPSFLRDHADADAWRRDGASAMGHAVELGADADNALSAATLLTNAGATQEAIRYLEHAYAFTEHPAMMDVHEAIGRKLATLQVTAMRDAADAAARAVDARWKREMPSVSRSMYLLLGPVPDPARCAGPAADDDAACARDWVTAVADQPP